MYHNKTHKRLLINLYEGNEVCVPVEVHCNQEEHEIHHYRVAYQALPLTSSRNYLLCHHERTALSCLEPNIGKEEHNIDLTLGNGPFS